MTLDEAIKHCLEVAEQKDAESLIDRWNDGDEWSESIKEDCKQCAAEHRQLAEWLTELKEAKRLLKDFVSEYDGCKTFPNHDEVLKLIGDDIE